MIMLQKHSVKKRKKRKKGMDVPDRYPLTRSFWWLNLTELPLIKIPDQPQRHVARIRSEKTISVGSNFPHPCILIVIYAAA